jgi:osmotically-inducible protein OsmY
MSEQATTSNQSSRIPPLANQHSRPGSALPAVLGLAGGIAALWLLEHQTGAVSRSARYVRDTAEEAWDRAGEWAQHAYEEAGEKGRRLSSDTRRHFRDSRQRASETAGDWGHSLSGSLLAARIKAAGLAEMLKSLGGKAAASEGFKRARTGARAGSHRFREAYSTLRGRQQQPRDWGAGEMALIGLTAIGIGAAAAYLMNPSSEQYRRALRNRAMFAGRRATEWATSAVETARDLAGSTAESIAGRFSAHAETSARSDEDLARRVRQRIAEVLSDGMGDIRVAAVKGRVTLTGRIPDLRREALFEAVRSLEGVDEVSYSGAGT